MGGVVDKSVEKSPRLHLYSLLKELGVYGAEVARELGCDKSAVSRFLSGDRAGLPDGQGERSFVRAAQMVAKRKRETAA